MGYGSTWSLWGKQEWKSSQVAGWAKETGFRKELGKRGRRGRPGT